MQPFAPGGNLTNPQLLALALALFMANQALELAVLLAGGHAYADMCIWDCTWYASIVSGGYDLSPHAHHKGDAANWAFFPVHPLMARALATLTGLSSETSLLVASRVAFAGSIFAFMSLAREYVRDVSPVLAGCVVAFNPYCVYANAGYTEPLFFLLSCVFLLQLRRGNYIAAGLAGCILTGVRFVGLFAVVAYVIGAGRTFGSCGTEERHKRLLGLLLIPAGLSMFMLALHFRVGDALAFMHVQRAWGRSLSNPLEVIFSGLGNGYPDAYWALVAVLALAAALLHAWRRQWELSAFCLLCTVVPVSTGLVSMPRYVFWQAPVLLVLAEALAIRKLCPALLAALLLAAVSAYLAWFSGTWHIV